MKKYYVFSFIFLAVFAFLNHDLFKWTNNNIIGIFTPKNESVFEHLKLFFYPSLLLLIIDLIVYSDKERILSASFIALSLQLLFVLVVFYTYSGFIGKSFVVIDIIISMVSIAINLYYKDRYYNGFKKLNFSLSIVLYIILLIIFIVFTLYPANIAFFKS